MNEGSKLLNNTFVYFLGMFGSRVLSFLLLPLYTYYLNPKDFGVYDIVITTLSLMIPFLTIQLSDAVYRWLLDSGLNVRLKKQTISSAFYLILTSLSAFYSGFLLLNYWFRIENSVILGLLLFSSSLFPFFQQILRGLGKSKIFAFTGVLNALLIVLFNCLALIIFELGLEGVFISTVFANIFVIIYIIIKEKIFEFINPLWFNKKLLFDLAGYSAPLVPNVISWWMISAANRYIIVYFLNMEMNGIYAISARFPTIITMINSIFMLAWQDYILLNSSKEQNHRFTSKVFNIYLSFELTLVIVLTFSSEFIVSNFFDIKYNDAWRYMPILYLATAFSALAAYFGTIYLKQKKTKHILITTLLGGGLNVLITILLIKQIGLYAPAIGTLFGFILVYLLRRNGLKNSINLDINLWKMWTLIICSFVSVGIVNFITNPLLKITLFALSIVAFILANREFLNRAISFLRLKIIK